MELEDNGIGDVIEEEDHVEIHGPFSVGVINIIDEFNFIIWE